MSSKMTPQEGIAVDVLTSVAERNLLLRGHETVGPNLFDQGAIKLFLDVHPSKPDVHGDEYKEACLAIGGFAEVAVMQSELFCHAALGAIPHTGTDKKIKTLTRSDGLTTYFGRISEDDPGDDELINNICAEPKNFEYLPQLDRVFFSKDCQTFLTSLMTEDSGCPVLKAKLGEGPSRIRFFKLIWQASVRDFVANGFAVRTATSQVIEDID